MTEGKMSAHIPMEENELRALRLQIILAILERDAKLAAILKQYLC